MSNKRRWNYDAINRVRRLHDTGKTFDEIAKEFGVSRQRISQIYKHGCGFTRKVPNTIYPGVSRWMIRDNIYFKDIAKVAGYPGDPGGGVTIRKKLQGKLPLKKRDIDAIIKMSNLKYETLFGEVKKNG